MLDKSRQKIITKVELICALFVWSHYLIFSELLLKTWSLIKLGLSVSAFVQDIMLENLAVCWEFTKFYENF